MRISNTTNATNLIGEVKLYAGGASHLPSSWMLCHGQALSRTDYAVLFSVIGESFGSGDGKDTFNLPDLRSRLAMGRDPLETRSNAGTSLGQTGGRAHRTLTANDLPVHSHALGALKMSASGLHWHSIRDPGHKHEFNYGHWNLAEGKRYIRVPTEKYDAAKDPMAEFMDKSRTDVKIESAGSHAHGLAGRTGNVGSGEPFSLLNPYQILDYIIFTGVPDARDGSSRPSSVSLQ